MVDILSKATSDSIRAIDRSLRLRYGDTYESRYLQNELVVHRGTTSECLLDQALAEYWRSLSPHAEWKKQGWVNLASFEEGDQSWVIRLAWNHTFGRLIAEGVWITLANKSEALLARTTS